MLLECKELVLSIYGVEYVLYVQHRAAFICVDKDTEAVPGHNFINPLSSELKGYYRYSYIYTNHPDYNYLQISAPSTKI